VNFALLKRYVRGRQQGLCAEKVRNSPVVAIFLPCVCTCVLGLWFMQWGVTLWAIVHDFNSVTLCVLKTSLTAHESVVRTVEIQRVLWVSWKDLWGIFWCAHVCACMSVCVCVQHVCTSRTSLAKMPTMTNITILQSSNAFSMKKTSDLPL
jgi:hypothetical protein